nr:MAG TPA: hypothetical protein [Bacteriophage sp.]
MAVRTLYMLTDKLCQCRDLYVKFFNRRLYWPPKPTKGKIS